MKKISSRKVTNEFIAHLFSIKAYRWHSYHLRAGKIDKIVVYLKALGDKDFRRLVSDPMWNSYRSYKYGIKTPTREEELQGWYGTSISEAVRKLIYLDKDYAKTIARYGQGFLLNVLMRNSYGEASSIASKRALKSKDPRARTIAAKIAPIKIADKFRSDPVSSVRQAAIKRIGINNCYADHLEDSSDRIRYEAMLAAPLSDMDYEGFLNMVSEKQKAGKSLRWPELQVARSILSKMSGEEVIHYLNLSGNDSSINEILSHKVTV